MLQIPRAMAENFHGFPSRCRLAFCLTPLLPHACYAFGSCITSIPFVFLCARPRMWNYMSLLLLLLLYIDRKRDFSSRREVKRRDKRRKDSSSIHLHRFIFIDSSSSIHHLRFIFFDSSSSTFSSIQSDMRCFSFFRRPKVPSHIEWKRILDDAYNEMEKAKPVLEKELSAAELETANHLAQYTFVYCCYLLHARDLRERVLKLVELKRRIDFLNIGMQYAQVLSNRIRTMYNLCNCPKDLEEAMAGLLYAGDRYGEIGALARFKSAMEEKYGTRSDIMYEKHRSLNKEVKRCLRVPCPSDVEVLDLIYDIAVRYHILHLLPDRLAVPITDVRGRLFS